MPRHHYVPRFLIRKWLVEEQPRQFRVRSYYWDARRKAVKCWPASEMQVCYGEDLFTIADHPLADEVERRFFGAVDGDGADAHSVLVAHGPRGLTLEQRTDFVGLMLSLDARRPNVVKELRERGGKHIRDGLNTPDLVAAVEAHGFKQTPAEWYEEMTGVSLEDDAMLIVQKLTDNPSVGKTVLNWFWGTRRLGDADGNLVLSDRPLIRINPTASPGAVWVLPLTPKTVLVAAAHQSNLERLMALSGPRFRRETNYSSAMQSDRYVFSLGEDKPSWLERRLPRGDGSDREEISGSLGE